MLRPIILFILLANVLFSQDYNVLLITNYNKEAPDYFVTKKAMADFKKEIHRKYKNVNFIDVNIRKDEEDLQRLQQLLQRKYLFIVAPGLSSIFQKVAPFLPSDTPVISGVSSLEAFKRFTGKRFTTASAIKYYKASSIQSIKKLINFSSIINLYDGKEGVYPSSLLAGVKALDKNISIVNVDIDDVDSTLLQQHPNALVFVSANSSISTKVLYDRFNFILQNIEFLYEREFLVSFYLPYARDNAYDYTNKYLVFVSSAKPSINKNIYEYSYLKNLKYEKTSYISRYDNVYRLLYMKTLLMLQNVDLSVQQDLKILHRMIFRNLEKTNKQNPFIEKNTRSIVLFEKEDGVYFNAIYKEHILNSNIYTLNKGLKLLYKHQIIKDKKIDVVYVTPVLKKIKILTLDAKKARVDMVVILDSKREIEMGKDIVIGCASQQNADTKLLSSVYADDTFHKVYYHSCEIDINNQLFRFPFDEQVLNIPFYVNNKNIMLQMISQPSYIAELADNWKVVKSFPSYSKNIHVTNKSELYISIVNYFTVKIQRKEPWQIIIKYFLPAMILLALAVFISVFIFRKHSKNYIGIVSDTLLGLISIYFIYSLLIQIETLIILDLIFYSIIFICVMLILFILFLEKRKRL